MKPLADYYKEIIALPNRWNYYDNQFFSYNKLRNTDNECISFLINYLGKGGKEDLPIFKYIYKIEEKRVRHIVSVFFLGMILYYNNFILQKCINKYLLKYPHGNEAEEQRFAYLWMLICLFHDNGYAVENEEINFSQDDFKIFYKTFPKNIGLPRLYSKKVLRQYYKYKECKKGQKDHGIVCGLKIYTDLCDLRKKKEEEDSFHYWGKELEKDFAMISWIIACHNIFFVNENDATIECYKCYNLNRLIRKKSNFYPISIKNHPIFFLFCLVDSIEPIKVVNNLDALESIYFDIENMKLDCSKLCPGKECEYKHKILGLKDWLLPVSEENGVVTIDLTPKFNARTKKIINHK